MKNHWKFWGSLVLAGLALTPSVQAASRFAVAPNARHQQECAACHVAYPPGLLPAASWNRIIAHLDKHFGTDASLDAAATREIAGWLRANAGTERHLQEVPPQDRISKSGWFLRQHEEVPAATWKRASIGSPSNCSACHGGAGRGNFNEREVRIPK